MVRTKTQMPGRYSTAAIVGRIAMPGIQVAVLNRRVLCDPRRREIRSYCVVPSGGNKVVPTEQYSTPKDTINSLHSRLQAVHRPFAGALVRVAVVPGANGPQFLTGTMIFGEQQLGDRSTAEYRSVQLIQFWIEGQDNALNYLSRFWSGQESVNGVPIRNTFNHSVFNHHAESHSVSGWPSWLYTVSADSRSGDRRLYLDQQPTVSTGLPPFRSPADAVRCWIYQEHRSNRVTNDVPYQEQFLVVIPDTRARLVSGRWRPEELEVAMEFNIPSRDLELQIVHVGSEKRSANYPVQTDPRVLEIPEDAWEIILYVVHKNGDLVCSHSLSGLYRSFGRFDGEVDESAQYAQELQRGESETREFKPFVLPKDKKEFEVVKTIVAFANTEGGTLFLGVDDEGVPLGAAAARSCFKKIRDPIDAQRARLKTLVTESTKPVPSVAYKTADVNGCPIVIAEVKKSPKICSTHDNRVYVRRGATSRLADPETELPTLLKSVGFDLLNG